MKFCTLFFILLIGLCLSAQTWVELQQYGGINGESCQVLSTDLQGNTYITGEFNGDVELGETNLTSIGDLDVYLAKKAADGSIVWAVQGGSLDDEEVAGVATDEMGNVYWTGMYWIEGLFGDTILSVTNSSRGIFLIQCDNNGQLHWSKSFDGRGLKQISAIQYAEGYIYLTGYFETNLLIGDTILEAASDWELFLIKMNVDGSLIWARQAGLEGRALGVSLEVDAGQNIVLAGHFVGKLAFASDTLQTATPDFDVFVAKFNAAGEPLWGRRAGGVFSSENSAIALDKNGHIYLTGRFLGVMKLDETIEIQTLGFHQSFYLLKYRSDGTPLWAKSFTGEDEKEANDMVLAHSRIAITGNFIGTTTIGDFSISSRSSRNNGFVAGFDLDGTIEWLKAIQSEELVFAETIISKADEGFIIGGHFLGHADFDSQGLMSNGDFDIYISELNTRTTSISSPIETEWIQFFPNPVKDFIFFKKSIDYFKLKIIAMNGSVLKEYTQPISIDVRELSTGVYYLAFETLDSVFYKKMIKID